MSKKESRDLVPKQKVEKLPDFLRDKAGGRGLDDVDQRDLRMPRIKVLQSNSPEVTDNGLEAGHFCNSLTSKDYGKIISFIPLFHFKSRIYWQPLDEGGGILCSAPDALHPRTNDFADTCLKCPKCKWNNEAKTKKEKAPKCTLYYNFVALIEGDDSPVVISLARTHADAAKKLLTLATYTGKGLDMFAKRYELKTDLQKSDRFSFYNVEVKSGGFVSEDQYKIAEQAYNTFRSLDIEVDQEEPGKE